MMTLLSMIVVVVRSVLILPNDTDSRFVVGFFLFLTIAFLFGASFHFVGFRFFLAQRLHLNLYCGELQLLPLLLNQF